MGRLPLLPALVAENAHAWLSPITRYHNQADLRCGLAAGFFAAVSFGFLPAIGINIFFCPAAALRGFFTGFFVAFVSAAAPPTLRRNASIRSTHVLAARPLLWRDRLAGTLLVDEVDQGRFVLILKFLRLEASGLLVHDMPGEIQHVF